MSQIFQLLLLSFLVFAGQPTFKDFKTCYKETSSKIPIAGERSFLDAYLRYLDTGKESDGKVAINRLLNLKPKDKTRISAKWIGIFEGAIELCCSSGGSSCSYSFGSASHEKLMPKVKRGSRTAIDLVLTYSTLVAIDGAEAESLQDYQKVIRKNDKAVDAFIEKNESLLKDYSINWVVD